MGRTLRGGLPSAFFTAGRRGSPYAWVTALLLVVGLPPPCSAAQAATDARESGMAVPGGRRPIAERLRLDPEAPRALFALDVIRRVYDAAWGATEDSTRLLADLVDYLDRIQAVDAARARLPGAAEGIELEGTAAQASRAPLSGLLDAAGLTMRQSRDGVVVETARGRDAALRRDALASAGIDVEDFRSRLNQNERVRLDLESELVPLPLGPQFWLDAIVPRADAGTLFLSIVRNRDAALLYYGLAAIDQGTREFLHQNPEVLARIRDGASPVFATFSRGVRVRDGLVDTPGGPDARPLWEQLVGESANDPGRFLERLLTRDKGRLAYFYDTLDHLDPARQAFALGAPVPADQRAVRFRALYAVFERVDPAWSIADRPFARTAYDPAMLLMSLRADDEGRMVGPASGRFWASVFDQDDPDAPTGLDMGSTDRGASVDAAWLAERTCLVEAGLRPELFETLLFGQRVFGAVPEKDLPDAVVALRGVRRFRMLPLTLERMGIRRPALHAAAVRFAARLGVLDRASSRVAHAQFQAALALVQRLRFARQLDADGAAAAVDALVSLPAMRGGYLSMWLEGTLLPLLAGPSRNGDAEAILVRALAGAGQAAPAGGDPIVWEGDRYVVSLAGSEFRRLLAIRDSQDAPSVDVALRFAQEVRSLASKADRLAALEEALPRLRELTADVSNEPGEYLAGGEAASTLGAAVERLSRQTALTKSTGPGRADEPVSELLLAGDRLMAEALTSLVYAVSLDGPENWLPDVRDVSRRHDLEDASGSSDRVRARWQLPAERSGPDVTWHFAGSLLGLDIALAHLSLRRISGQPPQQAPRLNRNDRETFVHTLALINPFALSNDGRDAIASALKRGRDRVQASASDPDRSAALGGALALSEWRRLALPWMAAHEPERIPDLFSASELMTLGDDGPGDGALDAWGMPARAEGCLCLVLAPARPWENFSGRPMSGLLATRVPDLNLRVAEALADRGLPASLARGVLAAATQDLIDELQPAHMDDWIAFVRYVRRLPERRFDDYISALAAAGPMLASPVSDFEAQR